MADAGGGVVSGVMAPRDGGESDDGDEGEAEGEAEGEGDDGGAAVLARGCAAVV